MFEIGWNAVCCWIQAANKVTVHFMQGDVHLKRSVREMVTIMTVGSTTVAGENGRREDAVPFCESMYPGSTTWIFQPRLLWL